VLALLAKVSLLALIGSLSARWMVLGVFLAHVVSRTWPLLLIRAMPHVGDAAGSKSKPLADQISLGSLGTAGVWCLLAFALIPIGLFAMNFIAIVPLFPPSIPVMPLLPVLTSVIASGLVFAYMGRLLWRRLQGFTGDGLGATQQVCEIAFYLGLALALP
jgi:adenosylcobinamide-GDP ribazoletransferase